MNRAIDLCNELRGTLSHFVVTSDIDWGSHERLLEEPAWRYGQWLLRPPELAQDDTPMIAVVQHVLEQIPGPSDQIIVLLQPTQPFRTPAHVREAIALLQTWRPEADSVVSLVRVPDTHGPEFACQINPWKGVRNWAGESLAMQPRRRQAAHPAYRRDGTVYACYRKTVTQYGDLYGSRVAPLIIPPNETCELDTEEQWADVERRWQARHA